jgi:hypothetical protein
MVYHFTSAVATSISSDHSTRASVDSAPGYPELSVADGWYWIQPPVVEVICHATYYQRF